MKQDGHEAVPIVNGGASTEESGPTIESALRELLRLYDWRNELGAIERDFNHDQKQMRAWLNQYGSEKKAAWEIARKVLE